MSKSIYTVCKNPNCNKKLIKHQKKYCSSSCAAIVNNIGVVRNGNTPQKKKCLNVSCEKLTTNPKYCSSICSARRNNALVILGRASFTQARRYIMENWEYKCSFCGIGPKWYGKSLTLQLDHINGDNKNNSLENLRWLCPNCHSQTETWGSKNMSEDGKARLLEGAKKGYLFRNKKKKEVIYCNCCEGGIHQGELTECLLYKRRK